MLPIPIVNADVYRHGDSDTTDTRSVLDQSSFIMNHN